MVSHIFSPLNFTHFFLVYCILRIISHYPFSILPHFFGRYIYLSIIATFPYIDISLNMVDFYNLTLLNCLLMIYPSVLLPFSSLFYPSILFLSSPSLLSLFSFFFLFLFSLFTSFFLFSLLFLSFFLSF